MKYLHFLTSALVALSLSACSSLQMAALKHQEGHLDEAIQLYEQHLSSQQDPDAHNNLANAYLQKHNFDKAISHYKQALALKDDEAYLKNMTQAYALSLKHSNNAELVKEAYDFQQASDKLRYVKALIPAQQPVKVAQQIPVSQPQTQQQPIQTPPSPANLVSPPPQQPNSNIDYSKLQAAAVKWAVVIGVSEYGEKETGYNHLPYAAKDAQKVYDYLTQEGGFAPEHVKLLVNQEATAENIREAFGRFLRNNANNPDDIVFVYYSGHGDLLDRTEAYIVPYGAKRQHLVAQGIRLSEVDYHINKLDSTKVAMFIDSCHSGSVIQGVNSKGVLQNVTGITQNFLNLATQGRLILTSSQSHEESLELEGTGGLFTHYLLKGLRGEADIIQRDKKVTVDELYQYVRRQVLAESRNLNRNQTPQKNGELDGVLVQIK